MDSMNFARLLREGQTPAEAKLWQELRGRKIGWKFRRQVTIETYIVDFCCHEAKLIVELDGDSHVGREMKDIERDERLKEIGYEVLRYENCIVMNEMNLVMQEIIWMCKRKTGKQ